MVSGPLPTREGSAAKALKEDLPAGARTLIQSQADIVKLAHDEVRALEKAHTR